MGIEDTAARWVRGLASGDEDAAQRLWEQYCTRLAELAARKIPRHARRAFDEEDVALSAFHSLCRGVQAGRFPNLDRNGLWALLVVITARKAMRRLRGEMAVRRGGGRVQGESVLGRSPGEDEAREIDRVIGAEPTPEFVALLEEESESFLAFLDDPSLRRIALLKIQGLTNDEVALRLGSTRRTVERRLGLIRRLWTQHADGRT